MRHLSWLAIASAAFLFIAIASAQVLPSASDKERLKSEIESIEKNLDAGSAEIGKKHEYCIVCRSNGARIGCSSPFGGEGGRLWCSKKCLESCGGCQVHYDTC
jgi:hypothetical protein